MQVAPGSNAWKAQATPILFPMYALRDRATLLGVSDARNGATGVLDLDDVVVKVTDR